MQWEELNANLKEAYEKGRNDQAKRDARLLAKIFVLAALGNVICKTIQLLVKD